MTHTKSRLWLPSIIAVITAIIAVAAFFLPFVSATSEFNEQMDLFSELKVDESSNVTVGDLRHISLFTYAKIMFRSEEVKGRMQEAYFAGGFFASVFVFAVLTFLTAATRKAVLTFLFNGLMAGSYYLVNKYIADTSLLSTNHYVWGVSHYLYYPLVALIAVCAVWMFIIKRKRKRARA